QILADGGHFERSPMYHAILLEDLLDLVQLGDRYPGLIPGEMIENWQRTANQMLAWLRVMTHPDGGPTFFNDSALEIAPELAALETYRAHLSRHETWPLSDPDAAQRGAEEALIV